MSLVQFSSTNKKFINFISTNHEHVNMNRSHFFGVPSVQVRSLHKIDAPFIHHWLVNYILLLSVLLVTFFRHLHYLLRRQDHILRAESLSLNLQSWLRRIRFESRAIVQNMDTCSFQWQCGWQLVFMDKTSFQLHDQL